jgi:hypothetical protein
MTARSSFRGERWPLSRAVGIFSRTVFRQEVEKGHLPNQERRRPARTIRQGRKRVRPPKGVSGPSCLVSGLPAHHPPDATGKGVPG